MMMTVSTIHSNCWDTFIMISSLMRHDNNLVTGIMSKWLHSLLLFYNYLPLHRDTAFSISLTNTKVTTHHKGTNQWVLECPWCLLLMPEWISAWRNWRVSVAIYLIKIVFGIHSFICPFIHLHTKPQYLYHVIIVLYNSERKRSGQSFYEIFYSGSRWTRADD